ncbi:porin [Algoriphagus taiwanensis]|uniref:Short chain amide porin n=1 Tax=Algoriphagus taiwanensis TaxID=1445656 RepID=A0ABQ6Q3G9_9BACT|nr:hypothetical protein Ataiwa_23000 [Algoriphagus taiwanensis]
MKPKIIAGILLFLWGISGHLYAQRDKSQDPPIDHSYKPLTLKMNEDGSKYVRFIIWNQIWAHATQPNPGTLDIQGNPSGTITDIGIRRARVLAVAQVSPRFLILTHFGINNQTFANGGVPAGGATGNGGTFPVAVNPDTGTGSIALSSSKKPQMFMHDVWTEYKISDWLYAGAGLHYWNGISRFSSHSTLNFMAVDAPIFNWPNIELTDQFARQFGFYAKGNLSKINYRVALNKPFAVGAGGKYDEVNQREVAFNLATDNWATQGYLSFEFLEKESNKLPYFVGSYLGTKKVFNLGAGWYFHPESTSSKDASGQVKMHDTRLYGLDAFLDMPLSPNGLALTSYAVWYSYDFGPNYLRNIGIMNVGFGAGTTQNGPGNAQPTIGTGSIFYTLHGLLLPSNLLKDKGRLQPFVALTYKDFEFHQDSSLQYDLGMNYYINGHQAKITFQYSQRPLFENFMKTGSAGEFILQTQIFL